MTEPRSEGDAAWEAIAEGWTERVRSGTDTTRLFLLDPAHLEAAGDVSGKRILDAGCGEGRFARMLAERGAEVVAFDYSHRMVELAQQAEAENPLEIEYFQGDMRDLSTLADASFDLVVAYLTILDVEDHVTALTELARVLKPAGELHFSVVHPCFTPPIATWEPRTPGTIAILDKDKLYKKVDNYFPAREVRFRMWPTAPAETINHHRTISDYAHACRATGLLIRDIFEPYPPEEVMAQRDYLRENYRAPTMILFQCVKP